MASIVSRSRLPSSSYSNESSSVSTSQSDDEYSYSSHPDISPSPTVVSSPGSSGMRTLATDSSVVCSSSSYSSRREGVPILWKRGNSSLKGFKKSQVFCICLLMLVVIILFSFPILTNYFGNDVKKAIQKQSDTCWNFSKTWNASNSSCKASDIQPTECKQHFQTCHNKQIAVAVTAIAQLNLSNILRDLGIYNSIPIWAFKYIKSLSCHFKYSLCDNATVQVTGPAIQQCKLIQYTIEALNLSIPIHDICTLKFLNLHSVEQTNCSAGFYKKLSAGNFCIPNCYTFNQRTPKAYIVNIVFLLISCVSGMLAAILIVFSFLLQCRSKPLFPTLYLIFAHLQHFVICILLSVSVIKHGTLNCSSKSLIESFLHPTVYCSILGASVQYFITSITVWIFFHTSFITYKVVFPIHSKKTIKFQNYIHFILVIAGWLFPLISVILALTNNNFRYVMMQFPPIFCASINQNFWFYSCMLAIDILVTIEICLLILVFWTVHKYQGILKTTCPNSQHRISMTEKKLLCSFCNYTIVGVVALLYFGLGTAFGDDFVLAAFTVFLCQASGWAESNCKEQMDKLREYSNNWLSTITFTLLTFAPVVSFLFIFNCRQVKKTLSLVLESTRSAGNLSRMSRILHHNAQYQTITE